MSGTQEILTAVVAVLGIGIVSLLAYIKKDFLSGVLDKIRKIDGAAGGLISKTATQYLDKSLTKINRDDALKVVEGLRDFLDKLETKLKTAKEEEKEEKSVEK